MSADSTSQRQYLQVKQEKNIISKGEKAIIEQSKKVEKAIVVSPAKVWVA